MKTLIIFRHSKTENYGFDVDHDRPLTLMGVKVAKMMGLYLSNKKQIPDLVISSTALRAKKTAMIAISDGGWPCPLILESGIYGGDPMFMLALAAKQDNTHSSICIVGHEPCFSNFIAQSTCNAYQHFPKGSMAKLDFDIGTWGSICMGLGKIDWIMQPQDLI